MKPTHVFYLPAFAVTAALALASASSAFAQGSQATASGTASAALVTLATTGNPEPLQAELGGNITSSEELQGKVGRLLKLDKDEHLAPKALVTPNGETYAMVAPTITKDNFIFVDRMGNTMRMDVGATEGHHKPFVVQTIVEDGGTPWYVELWYWLTNW
jgi:hypothetical protein